MHCPVPGPDGPPSRDDRCSLPLSCGDADLCRFEAEVAGCLAKGPAVIPGQSADGAERGGDGRRPGSWCGSMRGSARGGSGLTWGNVPGRWVAGAWLPEGERRSGVRRADDRAPPGQFRGSVDRPRTPALTIAEGGAGRSAPRGGRGARSGTSSGDVAEITAHNETSRGGGEGGGGGGPPQVQPVQPPQSRRAHGSAYPHAPRRCPGQLHRTALGRSSRQLTSSHLTGPQATS